MEDDNSIENPTTPVPEHASEESEYTYTISELRIAQVFATSNYDWAVYFNCRRGLGYRGLIFNK